MDNPRPTFRGNIVPSSLTVEYLGHSDLWRQDTAMPRNVGLRLPMTQRHIPEERDPHDLLWQYEYLPRQLKWTQIRPLNISTETDMVLRSLIQEPENLQLKHSCLSTSIKIRDFRLHKKTFCECPLILVMAANKNSRVNACCYKVRLLYLKWEIIPAVKVTLCMNTISLVSLCSSF
jgi:hypothetical protein